MLEEIVKEKTSADHLLYVSLKYTKTCDVILNLLARWKSLMENSYDAIIEKGVEKGKIPSKQTNPKQRIEFIRNYYKKSPSIQNSLPLYLFFKRIPDLDKTREGEFRKNVNLKIVDANGIIEINMSKLTEYSGVVDSFVDEVKKILAE
jgi:hypothetical protein